MVLPQGLYTVWARWNDGDCPIEIGSVVIVNIPCGSICGQVITDVGSPVSNVVIELYADIDSNGIADGIALRTTITDGDSGNYCFEDIEPGNYVVVETQPANFDDVDDFDRTTGAFDPDGNDSLELADNDIPVTLAPGENDMDNDFVEDPHIGNITGFVFDDLYSPMSPITIYLYADYDSNGVADGGVLSSTTTNAAGYFQFLGVEPSAYVLVEDHPFLYSSISDQDTSITATDMDGDDSADGPDNDIPVILSAGESDVDNIFVNGRPGTICGSVKDDTGAPISNVKVSLFLDTNSDGEPDGSAIDSAFTDGDSGNYCFEDVEPRAYVVVETQPSNFLDVSDYDHSVGPFDPDGVDTLFQLADNDIPVVVAPGESDMDNDFIEDPLQGIISGYVTDDLGTPMSDVTISLHYDTDGDGVQDGGPIGTDITNSLGFYGFAGIEPGLYVVVEDQPFLYGSIYDRDTSITATDLDGNDAAEGPDDNIPVLLSPGESDLDNNFMNSRSGSICGTVKDDLNAPISNVSVHLYADSDSNGVADGPVLATVMTDGDSGNYCFEDIIPGNYVVVEDQPVNYLSLSDYDHTTDPPDTDGDDSADGADDDIPVYLAPGEADMDNNFVEDPMVGSISGYVYDDEDTPINGVTIELYYDFDIDGNKDGASISFTNTNAAGYYQFTGVEPGHYVVFEIQQIPYSSISDRDTSVNALDLDGDDSADGPDNDIPVTITPGESDLDNNFRNGRPGTICGTVEDDTGAPLSNVVIELYYDDNGDGVEDAGGFVASTLTDGDSGNYCFEEVEPRQYVVVEIQPINYTSVYDFDMSTDPVNDPDGNDSIQGPDNNIPVVVVPGESDDGQ